MNSNQQFEDDDLALYAMGLLAEPEALAVARAVASSDAVHQRFQLVLELLAAFGQVSTELQPAPEGSLGRLMDRVAHEKKIASPGPIALAPRMAAAERKTHGAAEMLAWIGWAVAAVLIITAGKLYHDRAALNAMLTAQRMQVAQTSSNAMDVYRERDELKANLAEQAKRIQQLTAKTANAKNYSENLRSTVEAQSNQVAQLSTDAAEAREILAALTDNTALRVTLTKPKSTAVPLGRAVYVASRGTLVFLASDLAPLKANKVYQLWLMPANGSSPVPAGTFAPDAKGNASLFYAQFPRAVAAKGFGVTVENAGGSQTPTLPIILASTPRPS